MSIEHVSEKEQQLTHFLSEMSGVVNRCIERINELEREVYELAKERDDALYAGRLIVKRCDRLVGERDAAYERAAVVCQGVPTAYKEGMSVAHECAAAIRALKEMK